MAQKFKRYKLYLMNNKEYQIDEDDLKKLKANSEKMMVQLKSVIVHPSSIIAIEPVWVQGTPEVLHEDGKITLTGITLPPAALPDHFSEDVLKLN